MILNDEDGLIVQIKESVDSSGHSRRSVVSVCVKGGIGYVDLKRNL